MEQDEQFDHLFDPERIYADPVEDGNTVTMEAAEWIGECLAVNQTGYFKRFRRRLDEMRDQILDDKDTASDVRLGKMEILRELGQAIDGDLENAKGDGNG